MLTVESPLRTKPELTTGLMLECAIHALPYPHQIKDINVLEDEVRFQWRGQHFSLQKAGERISAWEYDDCALLSTDAAILAEVLINRRWLEVYFGHD